MDSQDDRTTQETGAVLIDDDLAPGTKLGEYEIEAKIGQGGMGVVFSAVHPLIGKRAAIKILKLELCADPGTLERFVDEARIVNQIGHPNIVDVFAFGEMVDGRSYFVMEWLKGESLRARLARSRLPLDEVRGIIKPLARALQAAHDKGVVHRDLKPDNVFLVDVPDEAPTAKLLDFGVAKLARSDHRVEKTATGAIVGTPQYIAPEQAKGYAIDARADIYALGAILFELLTGRPPFVADNAMEMVAKHLMEAPVRPASLDPSIPPELDDLVLRMLAKAPDGRPSLAEVVAIVERSRASHATRPVERPTPPPMTERSGLVAVAPALPPPTRPRRLWLALLGVPVAGVIAFVVVSQIGGDAPATPGPDPAPAVVLPAQDKAIEPPAREAPTPPPREEPAPPAREEPAPPAREEPPPVEKTGTLRIDVTNPGPRTEILIDDRPYTPDMPLAYGLHVVEIRSRGMQPKTINVRVGAPTTARTITLQPSKKRDGPARPDPLQGDLVLPEGDGLIVPKKN